MRKNCPWLELYNAPNPTKTKHCRDFTVNPVLQELEVCRDSTQPSMASEGEKRPTTTRDDSNLIDRQATRATSSSSEGPRFEPIRTRKTRDTVDYQFEHDDEAATRNEMAKIASVLSGTGAASRSSTVSGLQRVDTVAGMTIESPEFDPNSPSFNFFLWLRKFMQLLEQNDIRRSRTGFTFKNLNVSGKGAAVQLQKNVGSFFMLPFRLRESFGHPPEKQILRNFNGHVNSGELLIVLGRPGSGCSTFLKCICGELQGLEVSKDSSISYSGISQDVFLKEFKGEAIYNQENEKHFPHLTVGETLNFAASCRTPSNRVLDVPRADWAKYMASVMMNIYGLCEFPRPV